MNCAVCGEKAFGVVYVSECDRVCHLTCVKIIDHGQCTRGMSGRCVWCVSGCLCSEKKN